VLLLREVDGLSYEEIAETMGIEKCSDEPTTLRTQEDDRVPRRASVDRGRGLKKTTIDKRESAYADGALAGGRRARLERELEHDPALRESLQRTQSLSRLVREAWTEGPPAPPTDFLLARLRSELAAIDRERRARPTWQRGMERARIALGQWLGPAPIAASAAAAFLLALLVLPSSMAPVDGVVAQFPTSQAPQAPALPWAPVGGASSERSAPAPGPYAPADYSGSIYDVSPGERPARGHTSRSRNRQPHRGGRRALHGGQPGHG
jgi:hypothetical protein